MKLRYTSAHNQGCLLGGRFGKLFPQPFMQRMFRFILFSQLYILGHATALSMRHAEGEKLLLCTGVRPFGGPIISPSTSLTL